MFNYSDFSDNELALRIKDGDRGAFTEVYERFFPILFTHAFKRMRDEDEASDVVHDLFEFIWTKRLQLNVTVNFSSYLYAAVRNRMFNRELSSKRKLVYLDSLKDFILKGEFVTDMLVRERELSRMIEQEIAALPDQMRKVFELSRKQGLSHGQIAELLGTSEQTVRTQIKKSLRVLRGKLGLGVYILFVLGFFNR